MSLQVVEASYPPAPGGFDLLLLRDPEQNLNFYEVKFTASLRQSITDEFHALANVPEEQIWGAAIKELEGILRRRFS